MENIYFYLFCLVAIVVGILLVKKFVGCLVRSAILLIILAAIVYCYYQFYM